MTFEKMFESIHGYPPFPWQSRAAMTLLAENDSFSVNLPTASGKTALIDAGIYAAAQNGIKRIVFIINRRVVVDEAFSRAEKIASAMAVKPELIEFAAKIGPIKVVRLRGGVYGDDDWVLYPDRLTVLISTIDQVGSRLLHRGYGVSPRMAPMHAGFVGNDALFIIDEAHISVPFVETIQACRQYGAGIRLVAMTATPVGENETVLSLMDEDRTHPVLQKRLIASKQATLKRFYVNESNIAKEAVTAAQELSLKAKIIGIIVNRVATARQLWTALTNNKQQAILLTGRIRSYDRDRLLKENLPKIRTGRNRDSDETLFVVATQTVEVGADIDFDALVTEAASLDALRQRFGRLDRLGQLSISHAIILIPMAPDDDKKTEPQADPVYGMEILRAIEWLEQNNKDDVVDFGITAMEAAMIESTPPASEIQHAPMLLPSHLALLGQTGKYAPRVDVAPWLHGVGKNSSDVSVIWRADLLPDDKPNNWIEAVRLRPPLAQETLEIPVYAVHPWLKDGRLQGVYDIEGIEPANTTFDQQGRSVLRWKGPDEDEVEVIAAGEIRSGDVIVVPAKYGGCDQFGWDPKYKSPVEDIADFCSLERQREHIVRLVPELIKSWLTQNKKQITEAVSEILQAETGEESIDQEERIAAAMIICVHCYLKSISPWLPSLKNVFKSNCIRMAWCSEVRYWKISKEP